MVTLCVKRMLSPHTAEHVRQVIEEVLGEWKLPHDKISVILTDSGSNMVAAFRRLVEVKEGESDADKHEEEDEQQDDDDGGLVEVEVDDFERRKLDHEERFCSYSPAFPVLLTFSNWLFENLMEFSAIKHYYKGFIPC